MGKYLLVPTDNESKIVIEKIFQLTLLEYELMNTNIIIKNEIYTYFPFNNNSCGDNYNPVKISNRNFPEKLPNQFHNCSINLTGVKITPYVINITANKDNPVESGLEITIIYNCLRRLNFNPIFQPIRYSQWGYAYGNDTFTMGYKDLFDRTSDITFGMMIGNESLLKYFDMSAAHIDTAAVWVVPVALPIAQWKNLTVIFEKIVWLLIFMVTVLNGFTWWMLGKDLKETNKMYKEMSLCMIGSFYLLLQGSCSDPKTWKLRFVLIIWSISSLLLFTAHQCQLTGILTSPLYEHQISNIKELVDSDLEYGFYPILKTLYNSSANNVEKKILENFQPCSLSTKCINRTAFQRNFAVIKNKREVVYSIGKYYSYPSGKPILYIFPESEFVVWCGFYVRKEFPFLEKINQKLLLLQSNGLIAKWETYFRGAFNVKSDVTELQSLNLNHLQGAFYLLIIGCVLSFFIFISEALWYKLEEKYTFYRSKLN